MGKADYIGGRGESIASMRLDRIWRTDADLPYFWPHFLGEKTKTFDDQISDIAKKYENKLSFLYTGPWPPYNFVNIRLKLERAER